MNFIWDSITNWLKEVLVSGIVSNLSGMFDSINEQIGQIAGQVGLTPQAWNSGIFNMIQNLSNNVILPLAGAILAVVMTLELIQLITDRNNLNDVDTWMFFKWVFKSAAAVLIVSNTWTIVMGIFDAAQSVVNGAAGVMIGNTSIDISSVVTDLESRLMEMDVGPLLGLWFQSLFVGICTWAITICIFIVIYGRMIEVYLVTSVAPIPMATMANREWGQMGQNYLRSHVPVYVMNEETLGRYALYMATLGNRPDLFPDSDYIRQMLIEGYTKYDLPPEALENARFAAMIREAEKYLGYPYIWGGSSPSTSFDCSGYVCWVLNHSGWRVGRTSAQGLYNLCTPVSRSNARPGDLVFFKGTYKTNGVSHVGIYVGENRMIHCGNPISYTNINTQYWQSHFFTFGRLP